MYVLLLRWLEVSGFIQEPCVGKYLVSSVFSFDFSRALSPMALDASPAEQHHRCRASPSSGPSSIQAAGMRCMDGCVCTAGGHQQRRAAASGGWAAACDGSTAVTARGSERWAGVEPHLKGRGRPEATHRQRNTLTISRCRDGLRCSGGSGERQRRMQFTGRRAGERRMRRTSRV